MAPSLGEKIITAIRDGDLQWCQEHHEGDDVACKGKEENRRR
jgi:hypothetical protein